MITTTTRRRRAIVAAVALGLAAIVAVVNAPGALAARRAVLHRRRGPGRRHHRADGPVRQRQGARAHELEHHEDRRHPQCSRANLDATNPNGQVDLRQAWLDTERDTATNHDWLYFAWERDANSGSGFIAYEFMQNPAPAGVPTTPPPTPADRELQPLGQPHGRRLRHPVGPAGRQQGPVPAYLDRHRAEPDPGSADPAQRRRVPGGVQR